MDVLHRGHVFLSIAATTLAPIMVVGPRIILSDTVERGREFLIKVIIPLGTGRHSDPVLIEDVSDQFIFDERRRFISDLVPKNIHNVSGQKHA